jgi:hypothetical protein
MNLCSSCDGVSLKNYKKVSGVPVYHNGSRVLSPLNSNGRSIPFKKKQRETEDKPFNIVFISVEKTAVL